MTRGWLTIEREDGHLRAVLHTVIHRRPRDLAISVTTAARLAATGMPLVVLGFDDAAAGNAA